MEDIKDFAIEFLAIIALVLIVVALQKVFEYIFKRKMGE
ncbi:hypothetical protein NitYY0814_C1169 [Nitratiruptor sp. YY08-14]|nr:hypothetical protein NitYY0810_C0952 [Nitratiruptor sp. YY08-10]BCD64324.1 hypothetical protein NitYY0814_C1169 [Nitratiruptor sp. YY08-14]